MTAIGPAVAGVLFVLAASGCATQGRTDHILDRSPTATMSNRAARAWVDEYRRSLIRQTRDLVYEVYDGAPDWETREHAMFWGIFTEREAARCARYSDGLVAVVDMWTLTRQLADYFETGDGAAAFPEHRDQIVGTLRAYDAEARRGMQRIGDDDLLAVITELSDGWVEKWPIQGRRMRRVSMVAPLLEVFGRRDASVFDAVASIEETSEQIDQGLAELTYDLPVQIAAEAMLVVDSYLRRLEASGLPGALERLLTLLESLPEWGDRQAARLADGIGALQRDLRVAVTEERAATLAEVERQRLETIEVVTAALAIERATVLDAVERMRAATVSDLHGERTAFLEEIEAMRADTVERIEVRALHVVDRALDGLFWRALALCAFAGAGFGLLVALVLRRVAPR